MKHSMKDICFLAVAAFATAVAAHGESPTIVTSPASQTVAAGEGVSFEVSARNCDDFSVQLADGVSLAMAGVEPGKSLTHGFWIGKREVTQAQYEAVMGENPSTSGQVDNLPVDGVTWLDERVFCAKLTAREKKEGRIPNGYAYSLPTESQWEYAARGGNRSRGYKYSGNDYIGGLSIREPTE